MTIISPEAEVLLPYFRTSQIAELAAHERVPLIRDILRRSSPDAVCTIPLAFSFAMPAIAALQITQEFPGKVRMVTIEREDVIPSGVHRRDPTESHLYHPDSDDFESRFSSIAQDCMDLTGDLLDAQANVGEAFSVYPMAATITVVLTGTALDFRRLYETCGKRKGFLHPAVIEAAIDAIVEWKHVAPNLMLALETSSQ